MVWTETTIKTERLTLRPLVDKDKPAIREWMSSSEVRRFLGGPVGEAHLELLELAVVGEQWGVFCIADNSSDEPLGSCTLERERGELEVSFQLLPEYWGRGIAREAVAAAMKWVWNNADDRSIIAVTQEANVSSIRLLRSLGFAEEATFEEYGATQVSFRHTRPTSTATLDT